MQIEGHAPPVHEADTEGQGIGYDQEDDVEEQGGGDEEEAGFPVLLHRLKLLRVTRTPRWAWALA